MGRRLLVGHPKYTWREYVRERESVPLLVLDPGLAEHGPPGRAYVWLPGGKQPHVRFVSHYDPQRDPIALIGAAGELMKHLPESADVLLFAVKNTPVLRHLALNLAQMLGVERVMIPAGSRLERLPWGLGAEQVELAEGFPVLVQEAQRRARWLELLESGENHLVDLSEVALMGGRLGSGIRVPAKDSAHYAEVSGGTLHVVTDEKVEDDEVARLLDLTHASRLSLVSPSEYEGTICSFAHQGGDDFGIGVVQEFDVEMQVMKVRCTAVAPAPVRILKMGSLRVDESGRERGDVSAWKL